MIFIDEGGQDNRPKTGYRHTQSRIGTAAPAGKTNTNNLRNCSDAIILIEPVYNIKHNS